jgi:hypothetical protein
MGGYVLSYHAKKHLVDNSAQHPMLLLVAAYNAPEAVRRLIRYWGANASKMKLIKAVIVGTARERDSEEHNPTLEAAKETTADFDLTLLEAPRFCDSKAHQLNYALNEAVFVKDRVLVQDVDTRYGRFF